MRLARMALLLLPMSLQAQTPRDTAIRNSFDSVKSEVNILSQRLVRLDSLTKIAPAPIPVPVPVPTPVPTPAPVPPPVVSYPVPNLGTAIAAELPRVVPNFPYPSLTRKIRVPAGADLQAALNNAQCGDELLLNGSWIGNFYLPVKNCSGSWILVRSDTIIQSGRTTPATAGSLNLTKILAATPNVPAITASVGASYWWLDGLEIGGAPSLTQTNALVQLGGTGQQGYTTVAKVPDHIVITRSWIHGNPTLDVRRCVTVNVKNGMISDNTIEDCHSKLGDAQAILGTNGTNGVTIKNNKLVGSHETVMFGGDDPVDSTLSPRDVTLIGNHITRPLAWKGVWPSKNCIETKNITRYDVVGNLIENVSHDAQDGFCVVMKSENQGGAATYTQTADVTIRWNKFLCIANGFNFSGKGSNSYTSVIAARFTIYNNLLSGINTPSCNGDGKGLQIQNSLTDLTLVSNTWENLNGIGSIIPDNAPAAIHFTFVNNVIPHGAYGIKGSGTSDGNSTITTYMPTPTITGNAFLNAPCSQYPTNNTCPATAPTNLGVDKMKLDSVLARVIVP